MQTFVENYVFHPWESHTHPQRWNLSLDFGISLRPSSLSASGNCCLFRDSQAVGLKSYAFTWMLQRNKKKKKEKRKNSGAQACLTVPLLRHLFLSALSNHEFTRFIKAHNKGGSHCVMHPHRKLECVKLNKQLQQMSLPYASTFLHFLPSQCSFLELIDGNVFCIHFIWFRLIYVVALVLIAFSCRFYY